MPAPSRGMKTALRLPVIAWLILSATLLLLASQQFPAVYTVDLTTDKVPGAVGLAPPERGEYGPFRWNTGPVTLSFLPLGYPTLLELAVQGVRPEGQPEARLRLVSEARTLVDTPVPRSRYTVTAKLPLASLGRVNPVVDVDTSVFHPAGDPRSLGVAFYSANLRSARGLSVPAPWPAAGLLISVVLVYFAGRKSGAGVVVSFSIGVLAALFEAILNATSRPWLVSYSWYFIVPPLACLLALPWIRALLGTHSTESSWDEPTAIDSGEVLFAKPARSISVSVVTLAALILTWHFISGRIADGGGPTDNLTWGVSFYRLLPLPLAVVLALVPLACVGLMFGFAHRANSLDRPIYSHNREVQERGYRSRIAPLTVFTSLLAVIIFSVFQVQYSEGDSGEFDKKIPKGAIWRERELLDFYLKAKLWNLLQRWLVTPGQVYALVATIAGGAFVWISIILGRALGRTVLGALAVTAGLLFTGNILLFFGYVESYAPVTVVSLFVIWACWQYAEGRIPFGTVGASATIAPLFHGSAVWWGPMVAVSLLARSFRRPSGKRGVQARRDLLQGVGVGLAIVTVLIAVMVADGYDYERLLVGIEEMGGADARTMMPLFTPVSPYEHYVFFSWPHLGAVVQEQLLTAPLALWTIFAFCLFGWSGVRSLVRARPGFAALCAGAASMTFFAVSWNPDLGPRNDWDLLSLAALPLTLVAIYLLLRLPRGRPRLLALSAYLSVSGVHALAWVALHTLGMRY